MSLSRIGRRWLASFVLGTVAPLVLAQMTPPGGAGARGRGGGSPAWQACRRQADEKKVPDGDERRIFMRQCLETEGAQSEAARAKTGDPQSGRLPSDPPAAAPAQP